MTWFLLLQRRLSKNKGVPVEVWLFFLQGYVKSGKNKEPGDSLCFYELCDLK